MISVGPVTELHYSSTQSLIFKVLAKCNQYTSIKYIGLLELMPKSGLPVAERMLRTSAFVNSCNVSSVRYDRYEQGKLLTEMAVQIKFPGVNIVLYIVACSYAP